jgi:hypothetical protein
MTNSIANFHIENARIKMLEMENEEIRLFSKELMKKLMDMEKLSIEKTDPSAMTYSIKKKEKELREKEE